ncbi:MAG: tRNA (adenine-N1)-methyltransferase [Chloroflexota bacterium]
MHDITRKIAQEGELVLLYGQDRKTFIIRLKSGSRLQSHKGILEHNSIIGTPIGSTILTHLGYRYHLLLPSWDDLLRNIRRSTQIVYPKDIGYILMKLGIRPGCTVIEAGSGSGAICTAFTGMVMPAGHVYSYDIRSDMTNLAERNLTALGLSDYVTFKTRDITHGFDEVGVDALFLDVPAPWHYLMQAHAALRGGGFLGFILPTTNQVSTLLTALENLPFGFTEVEEIMLRSYKVVPARLRPLDRMIAHTGYLIFTRALGTDESEEE